MTIDECAECPHSWGLAFDEQEALKRLSKPDEPGTPGPNQACGIASMDICL